MAEQTIVERTVEVDAPAGAVWASLIDDDLLAGWIGGPVSLDPTPGGEGRFEIDGEVRRARVDEVEPGRRLSWRWWVDGDDDGPITAVSFELTGHGHSTRLVVVERPLLGGAVRASATLLGARLPQLRVRAAALALAYA